MNPKNIPNKYNLYVVRLCGISFFMYKERLNNLWWLPSELYNASDYIYDVDREIFLKKKFKISENKALGIINEQLRTGELELLSVPAANEFANNIYEMEMVIEALVWIDRNRTTCFEQKIVFEE